MMMRQVLVIRAKRERRRRQEARRLQLAEARAGALQAAQSAISRLAQAWQHPPALEVALKAAEAAARHPALPPGWAVGAECAPRLAAASAQLARLGELAWEQVELDELRQDAEGNEAAGADAGSGRQQRRGAVTDDALDADPLLGALRLPRRAARAQFAERLRHAAPPRAAPPLETGPHWAALVRGEVAAWDAPPPCARPPREVCLYISEACADLEIERRLLALDVLPYLALLAQRLGCAFRVEQPVQPRDPSWSRAILKGAGAPKYGCTTAAHAAAEAAEAAAEAARYAVVAEVAAAQLAECAAAGGVGPWYVGLVGDELRAPPMPPMLDAAEFDALVVELGSHYVRHDAAVRCLEAAEDAAAAQAMGAAAQAYGAAAQALAANAARAAAAWLGRHYTRDDNAVPPRCALAPPVAAGAAAGAAEGAGAGVTAGAEAAEAAAAAQAVGAAALALATRGALSAASWQQITGYALTGELVAAGWQGQERPRRRVSREAVGTVAAESQPASTNAPLAAAAAEGASARSEAPSAVPSSEQYETDNSYETYTPTSSPPATGRGAAPAVGAGIGVGIGAAAAAERAVAAAGGEASRLLLVARAFTDAPCEADAAVLQLRATAVTALPSHALLRFEPPWQAQHVHAHMHCMHTACALHDMRTACTLHAHCMRTASDLHTRLDCSCTPGGRARAGRASGPPRLPTPPSRRRCHRARRRPHRRRRRRAAGRAIAAGRRGER